MDLDLDIDIDIDRDIDIDIEQFLLGSDLVFWVLDYSAVYWATSYPCNCIAVSIAILPSG